MENAGTSPTQMMIAMAFILASILTLYFIPKAILDGNIKVAFFYLNLLLIGCVLGIVFIGQSVALRLCKFYIGLVLELFP